MSVYYKPQGGISYDNGSDGSCRRTGFMVDYVPVGLPEPPASLHISEGILQAFLDYYRAVRELHYRSRGEHLSLKITGIKFIRHVTGMGLKEAKDMTEALIEVYGLDAERYGV